MDKTLDERVTELESFYTDLPEILNLRFERMDAQLSELSGRFNLMDRQIAALTRDVRDLRGGVTRHLVDQGKRLTAMEARLDRMDGRLDKMEALLEEVVRRLPPRPA